jgi:hypothetical protein
VHIIPSPNNRREGASHTPAAIARHSTFLPSRFCRFSTFISQPESRSRCKSPCPVHVMIQSHTAINGTSNHNPSTATASLPPEAHRGESCEPILCQQRLTNTSCNLKHLRISSQSSTSNGSSTGLTLFIIACRSMCSKSVAGNHVPNSKPGDISMRSRPKP